MADEGSSAVAPRSDADPAPRADGALRRVYSPPVSDQLITIEPVEPDLTPARIDERLAAGWFPFGQRWMTCQAWLMSDESCDTIWLRVRLAPRPPTDRWRKLLREGCVATWHAAPRFDDEHQRLYERFRATRHPDWVEEVARIVISEEPSPLLARTRELAVRDAAGQLLAYRWFVEGERAIAGLTSIYETSRSGLGGIARALADDWAARAGLTWTYPGYVCPGGRDDMFYKIKPGRTEWLDPEADRWRPWEGAGPDPDTLVLAELRRRLGAIGEVVHYPGWALPCIDPTSRGLRSPYFVVGSAEDDEMTIVVWSRERARYEELRVQRLVEGGGEDEPEHAPGAAPEHVPEHVPERVPEHVIDEDDDAAADSG